MKGDLNVVEIGLLLYHFFLSVLIFTVKLENSTFLWPVTRRSMRSIIPSCKPPVLLAADVLVQGYLKALCPTEISPGLDALWRFVTLGRHH